MPIEIEGVVLKKFPANTNTDEIISGKYKYDELDMEKLAVHTFEAVCEGFYEAAKRCKNPILVAGRNFGCGSSREQAPAVLKACGIACIVAPSFARIFFRNAINIGLPLIEVAEERACDAHLLCRNSAFAEYLRNLTNSLVTSSNRR